MEYLGLPDPGDRGPHVRQQGSLSGLRAFWRVASSLIGARAWSEDRSGHNSHPVGTRRLHSQGEREHAGRLPSRQVSQARWPEPTLRPFGSQADFASAASLEGTACHAKWEKFLGKLFATGPKSSRSARPALPGVWLDMCPCPGTTR